MNRYDLRQELIEWIERAVGSLLSVPWHDVSTEDMKKLLLVLKREFNNHCQEEINQLLVTEEVL